MKDDGKDPFPEIESKVRKGRDRLKRIGALLKEIRRSDAEPEKSAFTLVDKLKSLDKAREDFVDLGDLSHLLSSLSSEFSTRAQEALQNAKTVVAASLAKELKQKGFELAGNLPQLSCGILTLEFVFESGGRVNIYFGPRIEKIKRVPIDPATIAESILSIYSTLDGAGFDEGEHIELMLEAYRNAARLLDVEPGRALPLSDIILQTAILKQGKNFLHDPIRETFSSYGRMQFAYDLSRTRLRSIEDQELHMTVASMEQTKHKESHIWIPRGPRDLRGTHFSMLAFRRAGR